MTRRRRAAKVTLVEVEGGCLICHGQRPGWTSRNALPTAARHHETTGHPTWVRQVQKFEYGLTTADGPPPPQELPGF